MYSVAYCMCVLYREVHKARDRKNGRTVALKKVRMENEKEGVSVDIASSPGSFV